MSTKCYVIPIRMACNADCLFCSSRFREQRFSGIPEVMPVNASFQGLLNRLASEPVLRYEVTGGGEPFLHRELQAIVDRIRLAIPSAHIKVYTNGHIFRRLDGINELNISVAHWDISVNSDIFRLSAPRPLISILEFFSPGRAYRLRLSVPMVRGGIDRPNKAMEMIRRTSSYVDGYVFRPLFPFTPLRTELNGEFDIQHPMVELDRGACAHEDILLWMPNNKAYTNWTLAEEFAL